MHRFIDGEDRMQQALLPHSLEDYVDQENPVRVVEVFIDELDLASLGFSGMTPAACVFRSIVITDSGGR
jgi:transposase